MSGKKNIRSFSNLGELISRASETETISDTAAESDTSSADANHRNGMPRIRLQRPIKVYCWRVIGLVAKAAKRAELMPILLRARERGATDASDVAEHLLFEPRSRRVVAERLMQIAKCYGLLEQRERQYVLTESGHTALATEQVFVPEHGTWTIWASKDPLLSTPILRVEPWAEPTAYEEVRGKERDNARERQFEKLPQWIRNAVGVVSSPLVGGALLRIDRLETEGEVSEPAATLRAAWDVSGARLRVDGTLGDTQVNTVIDAPEIGSDAVWMQLLQSEGLWPLWDPTTLALQVGFEDTTPGERESLVRAVEFRRPNVAGFGEFNATTVDGVALRARTPLDANRWAEWRLGARVRDYATTERFSMWMAEAVAPFAEFQPALPTRQALAEAAWQALVDRPTPGAWHLVAAEDWRL